MRNWSLRKLLAFTLLSLPALGLYLAAGGAMVLAVMAARDGDVERALVMGCGSLASFLLWWVVDKQVLDRWFPDW